METKQTQYIDESLKNPQNNQMRDFVMVQQFYMVVVSHQHSNCSIVIDIKTYEDRYLI